MAKKCPYDKACSGNLYRVQRVPGVLSPVACEGCITAHGWTKLGLATAVKELLAADLIKAGGG